MEQGENQRSEISNPLLAPPPLAGEERGGGFRRGILTTHYSALTWLRLALCQKLNGGSFCKNPH